MTLKSFIKFLEVFTETPFSFSLAISLVSVTPFTVVKFWTIRKFQMSYIGASKKNIFPLSSSLATGIFIETESIPPFFTHLSEIP